MLHSDYGQERLQSVDPSRILEPFSKNIYQVHVKFVIVLPYNPRNAKYPEYDLGNPGKYASREDEEAPSAQTNRSA